MAEFDMEKVRATFAEIDKDKSGTVDEAELTNLLKKHAENAQRAAQVSKVRTHRGQHKSKNGNRGIP